MSTIQKRDSENQLPASNVEASPVLKRSKSDKSVVETAAAPVEMTEAEALHLLQTSASFLSDADRSVRLLDWLAAWGAGRFNEGDVEANLSEFLAADAVLDVSSEASSGVPALKRGVGVAAFKEYFAFVGGFELEGLEMSHAAGPVPNEVWLRVSAAKGTSKATGKSTDHHAVWVFTFEADRIAKLQGVIYQPSSLAALLSADDVPIPSSAQLPTFEPHPNPTEPFDHIMALWGSGELGKREVRATHLVPEAVDDWTDAALPSVLKAYVGVDGIGEMLEHLASELELSNMVFEKVVGLKPGCVMLRATFDVKHKTTGKTAKGVQLYNECAYNVDGKLVYARRYWVNAPLMASVYSLSGAGGC